MPKISVASQKGNNFNGKNVKKIFSPPKSRQDSGNHACSTSEQGKIGYTSTHALK